MSVGKIIVCVLTAAVLLIWFLWAAFPTVFAAEETGDAAETVTGAEAASADGAEAAADGAETASADGAETAKETAAAPVDTAPDNSAAQGSGFRLEWYHYVIVSAIMFALMLFSVFSVKPAGKK